MYDMLEYTRNTQTVLIQPVTRVTGEAGPIRTGCTILARLDNIRGIGDRGESFICIAIHFIIGEIENDRKQEAMNNGN